MPRIIWVLLWFIPSLLACNVIRQGQSELEIRNGEPTRAYPSVGYVDIDNMNVCTGTVLSPTVVLTASHCVTPDDFAPFRSHKNLSFKVGGQPIKVKRFLKHPDYMDYLNACVKAADTTSVKVFKNVLTCQVEEFSNTCNVECSTCTANAECTACVRKACRSAYKACEGDAECKAVMACQGERKMDEYSNDVALLFLETPVLDKIKPAVIGSLKEAGEKLVMLGYGPRSVEHPEQIGTKSMGETDIGEIHDRVFTYHGTGVKRASLMGGDSGGPSFVVRSGKRYLVGVHSNISSYCDAKDQLVGVDIRVDQYLDWIRKEVPDLQVEGD